MCNGGNIGEDIYITELNLDHKVRVDGRQGSVPWRAPKGVRGT